MSTATRESPGKGPGPPPMHVIERMEDVTVGMRVEAKDSYGKWFCAKVVEKDKETEEIMVHFEGWSSRYDELIPIRDHRLRNLSQEMLEKTVRVRRPKVVEVGDRVQAKWQDGRMYYGRVLQLLNQMAVVLFDDGVQYTTPISTVRKRNPDPSPLSGCEGSQTPGQVNDRRKRRVGRKGKDDSASQPSNSPPSSPLFAPKRFHTQSNRFWETDESSCTESDEDGSKRQKRDSSPACASSDGDLRPPQGKRPARELREPYKLRKKLARQRYAPVVRKRKLKGSASSSASEAVTVPVEVGGDVRREVCAGGEGVPCVKVEGEDLIKEEASWKSSDEDATTMNSSGSSSTRKEEGMFGATGGLSAPDSSTNQPPSSSLQPPSSPPPSLTPRHSSPGRTTTATHDPTSPSLSKDLPKSRRRAGSGSQGSSVTTRYRAQTSFENSKLGKRRERGKQGKQGKVAPKELVIVWDHNEFKCTHSGCTKSFRKQSLLESHMKHYHDIMPSKRRGKTATTAKVERNTAKSAQSPSTSLTKSPKSPSSPSLSVTGPSSSITPPSSSSFLESSAKRARLNEQPQQQEVSSRETSAEAAASVKMKAPPAEGSVGSKSPKKSRPKPLLSKSSTGSTGAESVGVAALQTTRLSVGQPKNMNSPIAAQHAPSHHFSSLFPSKPKQSSGKKQKEKSLKETPRKAGETVFESHASPALPSSTAAGLPVQRNPTASGSHENDETGAHTSGAGGELGECEGGDVRVVPSVPTEGEHIAKIERLEQISRSTSPSSEANDDVVHCICGDDTDEGFMIQCEQCLCWQHGGCIGISKQSLPKQYICCFCTNPPGLRQNRKYQYDLQWYCDGTLPSLPGGPKFPSPEAMLKCHSLLDKLYLLRKMSHSSKVKLQAASTPNHAYLRQWSKECASLDKETLKNYLAVALEPVVIHGSEKTKSSGETNAENREDSGGLVDVETDTEGHSKEECPEGIKLTNGNGVSPVLEGPKRSVPSGSVKMSVLAQVGSSSSSASPALLGARGSTVIVAKQGHVVSVTSDASRSSPPRSDCESKSAVVEPTRTEPDYTFEFGVQELSVFAVRDSDNPSLKHFPVPQSEQKPGETISADAPAPRVQPSTSTATDPPVSLPAVPSVPLLAQKMTLKPSTQSAFKPVVIAAARQSMVSPSASTGSATPLCPKTPTCGPSQLTSLLTSPISTQPHSLVQPPVPATTPANLAGQLTTSTCSSQFAASSHASQSAQDSSGSLPAPQPCVTQLSRLKLVPNVRGDPLFVEMAATLPNSPSPAPVLLKDFTEAFVHGDTTNWFKRMLLLDHIESVQDSILSWVEHMEKEVDELSGKSGDATEEVTSGIQTTLDQLNTFHSQVLAKTR